MLGIEIVWTCAPEERKSNSCNWICSGSVRGWKKKERKKSHPQENEGHDLFHRPQVQAPISCGTTVNSFCLFGTKIVCFPAESAHSG